MSWRDEIRKTHSQITRRLKSETQNAFEEALQDGLDYARQESPVDTGDLRSTIRGDVYSSHTFTTAEMLAGGQNGAATGNYVDYARYVEEGDNPAGVAQPFLQPGFEVFRASLEEKLANIDLESS